EVDTLGSHTFTEAEITAFASRYDPQPFHVDPVAARTTIFGGLIASGWHTCAVMMRLSVEAAGRAGAAGTGPQGIGSCRWVKPVRPGDTLSGRSEVLETWPSHSRPFGFVRRRIEMRNQRDELVLSVVGVTMYQRRAEPAP